MSRSSIAIRTLDGRGKLTENPILHAVAAVSVGIVDGQALLDLCYTEDAGAAVDFNLVMNSAGEFIELQGTGEEATFSEAQLAELLTLGKAGVRQLLEAQEAALARRERRVSCSADDVNEALTVPTSELVSFVRPAD